MAFRFYLRSDIDAYIIRRHAGVMTMCLIDVTTFLSVAAFLLVVLGMSQIVSSNLHFMVQELKRAGLKTTATESQHLFWRRLTKYTSWVLLAWLVIYVLTT